jgi:hypothetical protein
MADADPATLRGDSGYRSYTITTGRITSCELLKYWNRLFTVPDM